MHTTTQDHLHRFGLASPLAVAITAGLFVLLLMLTSKQAEYVPVVVFDPPVFRPLSDRPVPPDPPDRPARPVEPVVGGAPLPVPTPTPVDPRLERPGPSDPWVYHGPGPTGTHVSRIESRDPIVVLPPRPDFPERARAHGIEGYAIVVFTVTATGMIRNAQIVEAHPSGWFEKAAVAAASRLRYQPKLVDGKPVEAPGMMYKFVFDLED